MAVRLASVGRFCAFAAVLAAGTSAWSPAVHAQADENFLSLKSEPGDYIGGGQSLTFTPADSAFSSMVSQDRRSIAIAVIPSGSFWYLNLAAPAGQELLPGVYENAARAGSQSPTTPGLDFYGDGRGCNTVTGRFEVLEAVYAPYGYVERFHATFEQHCDGGAALIGEVKITNPPPPPVLTIELTIDAQGAVQRAAGAVKIGGTIKCSQAASAQINGTVNQRAGRFAIASGSFYMSENCTPEPKAWSARVSGNSVPFNSGPAEVSATTSALDPNFNVYITVQDSSLVQLKGSGR
jgi:hypothetical protein